MADSSESMTQSVPSKHRIGHVGCLRPGGAPVVRHGLQHLRGGDDGFSHPVGAVDEPLLNDGNLLDRYFHPEVSARNHDAVRRCEDIVHMFQRIGAFNFRDDERVVTHCGCRLPHGNNIRGALDEGLADRIHPLIRRQISGIRGRDR